MTVDQIQLSDASGVPYHEQIAEQLCRVVGCGDLRCGASLPSAQELARRLLVSPRTIERAFMGLEAAGLVRQSRAGEWVLEEGAEAALRQWSLDRGRSILTSALSEAHSLGLAEGESLGSEAERLRREVELEHAREVQLSMLPSSPPELEGFDVAVEMVTAGVVGGDYYDFFPRPDGTLWAVIGDATGHGAAAGMMMAMAKASLHAVSASSPGEALARSNLVLRAARARRLLMALAILELGERSLTLASAGMPPVFLRHAASGEVEELLVPGLPLGNALSESYPSLTVELAPGDVVVAMSDGLPELEDRAGEQLGASRIISRLAESGTDEAGEILESLSALASGWTGDLPAADDMTLLVVRRGSRGSTMGPDGAEGEE